MRSQDLRLAALKSALITISEELYEATRSNGSEEALEERVGRIAHIAASACMTVHSELPPYVSSTPMFVRCPDCKRFHAPGFCSDPIQAVLDAVKAGEK